MNKTAILLIVPLLIIACAQVNTQTPPQTPTEQIIPATNLSPQETKTPTQQVVPVTDVISQEANVPMQQVAPITEVTPGEIKRATQVYSGFERACSTMSIEGTDDYGFNPREKCILDRMAEEIEAAGHCSTDQDCIEIELGCNLKFGCTQPVNIDEKNHIDILGSMYKGKGCVFFDCMSPPHTIKCENSRCIKNFEGYD
ncbi:MAG TPA: hypothetical protein VJH22_06165 [Candidatus Nanoarchaeia archaeon]|nr:hypothetical protein [Candidatus Nanoarchaeia archaeon]